MSDTTIRVEYAGALATITLARPEVLNAFSPAMVGELSAALDEVAERGARALVITGDGRAFSSGAQLSESAGLGTDLGDLLETFYNPLIEKLFALPIPVVSAVNGAAAGAGCSLALAADFVVAARSAYFLQAFVNIGLVPDAGASWLLPRLVGRQRALEMMMLGERLPAEKAEAWGLIHKVVDDDRLMPEAAALARRLAAGATHALGATRRMVRAAMEGSLTDALAAERDAQREAGRGADFTEGVAAFLAKRPPLFVGR